MGMEDLQKLAREKPLIQVADGEKILILGAAGQIGEKLSPILKQLYGKENIILADTENAALNNPGMIPLDVTKTSQVIEYIKQNNVKVVINLAALLSAASEQSPNAALQVNLRAANDLMFELNEEKVRSKLDVKVMVMSSIARNEFRPELAEDEAISDLIGGSKDSYPDNITYNAQSLYGATKDAMVVIARMLSKHFGLQVVVSELSGVLATKTPWPSDGTTEEVDKLIVACAAYAVFGDKWTQILADKVGTNPNGETRYIRGGYYVPEVTADAKFSMVDSDTLVSAVIKLLHVDTRQAGYDPLFPVAEYQVSMNEAMEILRKKVPGFPIKFPNGVEDGANPGKCERARVWGNPAVERTVDAIREFRQYNAEDSILKAFNRAKEYFQGIQRIQSNLQYSELEGAVFKGKEERSRAA